MEASTMMAGFILTCMMMILGSLTFLCCAFLIRVAFAFIRPCLKKKRKKTERK